MAIQIQGYRQQRELQQGTNTPAVRPGNINVGLGEAIEQGASRALAAYERISKEKAETESLAAAAKTRMDLETTYKDAQNQAQPGATGFTPAFMKTVDGAVVKGAEGLTSEESRKRYRERMLNYQVEIQHRALTWESEEQSSKRTRDFQTSADNNANSVYTVDGVARDATYKNLQEDLNLSLDNVELHPSVKQQLRDEAKTKMSYAAVQGDLRDRPEKVQDWLVKQNGADYYSKLRSAESGGQNIGSATSSAFGPYQFTKGSWETLIKSHPELKLTEADRYNPAAQESAIRAFTQDNAAVLQKNGIPLTNTNVYMSHFLGSGGAVRFLKAFGTNPNDDARLYVGADQAAANPGIFRTGRTVGDVMALFGKKFGDSITWDKGSGTPAYYADIPFMKRDALYSAAETEMHKRRISGEAAFAQRVQNSMSEFASGGTSLSPPSEQEFVAAYGAAKGTVHYGEFVANSQAAAAGFKLQQLPLNEHSEFIESFKPQKGDPFFAEKEKGYEKVRVVGEQIRKQVTDDFGQYITNHNAVARQLLASAFDPEKPQSEAAAAADQFAQIMTAEANRLNIPASNRAFLPKSYSNMIAATLNQQLIGDGQAAAKVQMLNAYSDRFGEHWPNVYRELKENMSSAVQVITSGIKDKAAIILASVHDKSFDELTKAYMPGTDKKDLEDKLRNAFEPFLVSTMWQQSSLPGVNTFYEQAKKIAAVYVAQGNSTSNAAESAYNDVLGFKYRMSDRRGMNVRIPKDQDLPGMESYLRRTRADLLNSDRITATSEELKKDPNATDRLRTRLLRDSKWVTSPDNSGIELLYQGELWSDNKGKPLRYTWDELKQNYGTYKSERQTENEQDIDIVNPLLRAR